MRESCAEGRERIRERGGVGEEEYLPVTVSFDVISHVAQKVAIMYHKHTNANKYTHKHTHTKAGLTLLRASQARNSMECLASSADRP
jgi:hypothetical protein